MEEKGRLPEGIEWPRFEDKTPVRFGDMGLDVHGRPRPVMSVKFTQAGLTFIGDDMGGTWWDNGTGPMEDVEVDHGKRVKRPSVLAADGEPLEVGQTVYVIANGKTHHVTEVDAVSKRFRSMEQVDGSHWLDPMCFTHQRPVLGADGVPIRKGDTVYLLPGDWCDVFPCLGYHGGEELEVFSLHVDHVVGGIGCRDTRRPRGTCYPQPSQLTHRATVLAADGKPLREGETVWDTNGDELVIGALEDGGHTVACRYVDVGDAIPVHGMWSPSDLTHHRPEIKCRDCAHWQKDPTADNMGVCWFFYHEYEGQDCYPARLGDIGACEEFMPRARALAERERGE